MNPNEPMLDVRCFWQQKAGNSSQEYEDAFCVPINDSNRRRVRCNSTGSWKVPISRGNRIAVADGATETSFSGIWARLLAREYCRGTLNGTKRWDAIARCREVWKSSLGSISLPWYAEQKLAMGAFSAIVGISFLTNEDPTTGTWHASAVGDSCLFQFRDRELLGAFPLNDWRTFSSRPSLISSVSRVDEPEPEFLDRDGEWILGDEFYLASDALAHWILVSLDLKDADPLSSLQSILTSDVLTQFTDLQRNDFLDDGAPRMRNDDITIVRCCPVKY